MILSFSSLCIAANSGSITIKDLSALEDRRPDALCLHTSVLDQCNDPSHVRDGLFIEFSTTTAFIKLAVVEKGYLSTHNTPEMRNQYLSGVFSFLKHASGDEIDICVVPLQRRFNQQRCTLHHYTIQLSNNFSPYLFASLSIQFANDMHIR